LANRFIRASNEKKNWRMLNPDDVKQIIWKVSAKGNYWFEKNGVHVVVYPIVAERPYGKLFWYVKINGDTLGRYESEKAAKDAALEKVGLKKPALPDAARTEEIAEGIGDTAERLSDVLNDVGGRRLKA